MKKVKWKYFTQPLTDPHRRSSLGHQSLSQLAIDSGFDEAALTGNVEPLQQTRVSFIYFKENAGNFFISIIHSYFRSMVNLEGNMILFQTQNLQDIKEKIEGIVEAPGFDQVCMFLLSIQIYSPYNNENNKRSIKHADTDFKVTQFNIM